MTMYRLGSPTALLAGLALAAPLPAAAGVPDDMLVQYRYTGLPFEWVDNGAQTPRMPHGARVSVEAFFLFEDFLAPDSTFRFNHNDGVPGLVRFGIATATPEYTYWRTFAPGDWYHREGASAELRTGAAGKIVAWSFLSSYLAPMSSDETSSRWDGQAGEDAIQDWSSYGGTWRQYVTDRPGTWTVGYTAQPVTYPVPPPIPVVPEPDTWALFGLGLLGVGWRARRAAAGAVTPVGRAAG